MDDGNPWVPARAGSWTYEVPSEAGWYWWQEFDGDGLNVVCVFDAVSGGMGWFNHSEDEWYGEAGSHRGRWSAIPEPPSHEAWTASLPDA